MTVKVLFGDCRDVLRTLPDQSVHCVVTSPPYWGLRDYDVAGQMGLEPTYIEHVEAMATVFDEVRRVLRDDGTLWLNYGDSYATSVNGRSAADTKAAGKDDRTFRDKPFSTIQGILKPKDLCGMPWRVAFALQNRGWYLRQDIIWHKPNPMPESTKDRCTRAHEYIFMLSKKQKYFYDAESIKEPRVGDEDARTFRGGAYIANTTFDNSAGGKRKVVGNRRIKMDGHENRRYDGFNQRWDEAQKADTEPQKRNKRSVWTVAPKPFSEAHFATFPPALIEPCIKAGCPVGGTVLDPFGGAGTTGLVADRLGRNAILIELNPDYAVMALRRLGNDVFA